MRFHFFLFVSLFIINSECHLNLWPLPSKERHSRNTIVLNPSLQWKNGTKPINPNTLLGRMISKSNQEILSTKWKGVYRNEEKSVANGMSLNEIRLRVSSHSEQLDGNTSEAYELYIPSNGSFASIDASSVFGALRGIQTFIQLIELDSNNRLSIPFTPIEIKDSPAFGHRGISMDTSRNYFPVADLKRIMEGMWMNKLNVFHWHIVDSQSFPLQSEALPELSDKGAYGKDQVYSKTDIQDLVQFAKDRGIRVIPEIDMPGHTRSWAFSHPEITTCVGSDWQVTAAEPPAGQLDPTLNETYSLLSTLFKDVAPWFIDSVWHAGGDEVNFKCWGQSPNVQKWMKDNGQTDYDVLLKKFTKTSYPMITSLGKTITVWEEMVLNHRLDLDKNTIVQVWTDPKNVKRVTELGYKTVVSSVKWYLDCGRGSFVGKGNSWCDPYKTWGAIYEENILEGLSSSQINLVLGGEVALWAEQTDPANLDRMLWPRAAAAAENLWTGMKNLKGYSKALPRLFDMRFRLLQKGIMAEPLQPLYCAKYAC